MGIEYVVFNDSAHISRLAAQRLAADRGSLGSSHYSQYPGKGLTS